jgi:DNA-binding NarL/FixJ family response regulator
MTPHLPQRAHAVPRSGGTTVVRRRRGDDPRAVPVEPMPGDAVGVLVVDDQESFRDAVGAMIGVTRGFRLVGTAASGDEAVAQVEARGVDLVLVDVNLGPHSGLDLCRVLLAVEHPPAVLLMSAYRREELPADLESVGVPFVAKDQLNPTALAQLWLELGRRERTERG